ncbi:helix-turn-helix domain-containing protein [Psychromonas sp. MME2]|uniref:helix-turn-helix domain-containing protein n=1 Tax=unclassified Psychromonas TaxID=2614957 RepID=UPI00339BD375
MSKQHKNATTTPEMRAFIHQSDLPTAVLARLLKISEATVRKWRKRSDNHDASHIPKQLHTTLSAAQEFAVVHLRTRLKLSLDELLSVCKHFINEDTSRAGLQRCLKRHGVSKLADMDPLPTDELSDDFVVVDIAENESNTVITAPISPQAMSDVLNQVRNKSAAKPLLTQQTSELAEYALHAKSTPLSNLDVVQVNVTVLPTFSSNEPQYRLLVANDPEGKWVYVDLYSDGEKNAARRYMKHVLHKAPFHIRRVLVANYTEFISRFSLLDKE